MIHETEAPLLASVDRICTRKVVAKILFFYFSMKVTEKTKTLFLSLFPSPPLVLRRMASERSLSRRGGTNHPPRQVGYPYDNLQQMKILLEIN
ncbi:hypothetical protein Hanom_Chr02g00117201 [Helianthus anomalus]